MPTNMKNAPTILNMLITTFCDSCQESLCLWFTRMDAAEKLIGSKNGEELDRKAIQDFVKEADSHEE